MSIYGSKYHIASKLDPTQTVYVWAKSDALARYKASIKLNVRQSDVVILSVE